MINHSGQYRALKTQRLGNMGLLPVLEGFCSLPSCDFSWFSGRMAVFASQQNRAAFYKAEKYIMLFSLWLCPTFPTKGCSIRLWGDKMCCTCLCTFAPLPVCTFIGSVFSALPPAERPDWGLLPLCQSDFSHLWAQVPLHFLRGYDGGNGADILAANVGWGKGLSLKKKEKEKKINLK